jgi:putative hemolysin
VRDTHDRRGERVQGADGSRSFIMVQFLNSVDLWLPGLFVMLALVVVSGFFSASETALFSLTRDEVRAFRMGSSGERRIASLMRDPDRLLTAILFWNLLINLCYFAVSVVVSNRLVHAEQHLAAGAFGMLGLLLIIICGEVVPKSLAVVIPRGLSLVVVFPLSLAVRLLDSVGPTLNRIGRLVRRTFWPHIKEEPYLYAEDLERAVDLSSRDEQVVQHERQILHNILDLSEIQVEEVMRPRGSYVTLDESCRLADFGREAPPGDCILLMESGSENLEGMLPLVQIAHLPEDELLRKTEPVLYVPWTANLAYTLQLMTRKFSHVASVVNEYGENIGIVTYDDIMDSVISPEPSRARRVLRREPVLEVAPGKYHVAGITTLRYLSRRLNLDFEPSGESPLTVAGLLHEEFERFPQVGDECIWEGFRFKVIDADRRGGLRAIVFRDHSQGEPDA